MTTRVIIGCSAWRDYQFLVPMSALLWRELVGYTPLVLITGNWEKPMRGRLTRDLMQLLNIEYQHIGDLPGREESSVAQNCRQHACALPLPDDDWLMLSDADLWPVTRDWYRQHEGTEFKFVAYYSNGDHYQSYPTCHMTAKAKTWREIMSIEPNGKLLGQLEKSYREWRDPRVEGKGPSDAGWVTWNMDQWRTTKLIKAMPWYNDVGAVLHIERKGHPPVDRIDRGHWREWNPNMVDAHVLRAPDQPGNWEKVRALFGGLLPGYLPMVDAYRNEYLRRY